MLKNFIVSANIRNIVQNKKQTSKKMNISAQNPRHYFYQVIRLHNACVSENKKLRDKEREFLLECCMFHYEGGDLTDLKALKKHMKGIGFFNRIDDTSIYKCKLSASGWAKTGHGVFTLPPILSIRKGGELNYEVKVVFDEG